MFSGVSGVSVFSSWTPGAIVPLKYTHSDRRADYHADVFRTVSTALVQSFLSSLKYLVNW
jgi:hypothetical protein